MDWQRSEPPENPGDHGDAGAREQDGLVIPVLHEELHIGRQKRETGRLRIRKMVDLRERTIEAPVRYEEVNVERVPVNAVVSPDAVPLAREENGVLIVPVLEEVVVVQKVLMLKEELRITRTERLGPSTQQVALRAERVELERMPPEPGATSVATDELDHGEQKMHRTLVGVYDSQARAQQVREELLTRGFGDDEVQVSIGDTEIDVEETSRAQGGDEPGGIVGFFRSLFGGEDDETYVNRYSDAVRRGSAVVTVDADSDDQLEEAQQIMNRYDPLDVDTGDAGAQTQSQTWAGEGGRVAESGTGAAQTSPGSQRQTLDERDQRQSVPIVEEELQIGKRTVSRGGVRVFTRIEEEPVEETVRLREERATVERTPVDRPATPADMQAMREGVIEVRETAEEAVVAKRARVVEEVRVGKQVDERSETVRDTVRHTEIEVANLAPEDDEDFRRHWQAASGSGGGRFEDYEPAYRYGSSLASDQRYRGSEWDRIEPDVRRDWETRSPGTWERMKESVRHAWNRARR
jgi:uncharacterized protein (TIGR02271 family)